MTQPKYMIKARERAYKKIRTDRRFAENRTNIRRRMKRLLGHPEYGKKFARLDARDQDRIITRIASPYSTSARKKQKLIFADIDSALEGKQKRLKSQREARKLGIRGKALSPEERARNYARLSPEARSELWQSDETAEFWALYRREMGYA